jgi:hypothetical protein
MVYGLIGVMAEAIDEAVITFEKNVDLKLSALLLLGTAEFERQKADLLGAIDLAVRNYKNVMDMQIAAKHTAVQTYEREHPELSSRKCTQMMQQLFMDGLATTEEPSGTTGSILSNLFS